MSVSDRDLAYLAGLVDGEGCITITLVRKRYHMVQLRIANTDPRMTRWLQSNFGGGVTIENRQNARWKVRYTWCVGARAAEPILRAVLPHLLLKRDQAEIALACRELTYYRGNRRGLSTFPEREALKQRLHVLNRKGPHVA